MGWSTEQKVASAIIVAGVAYGFKNAGRIKDQRIRAQLESNLKGQKELGQDFEPIQKVPTATERLVDHPLVGWFIENSHPWWSSALVMFVSKKLGTSETFLGNFWRALILNFIGEEVTIYYYMFISNYVYSHVPRFSEKYKRQTFPEILKDFLSCNFINLLVVSAVDVIIQRATKNHPQPNYPSRFRPLLFMGRLLFSRLVTDLFFWIGHYIIHLRSMYFIHKKHHEHNIVMLTTNYHFSSVDLFIEASLPILVALLSLKKISTDVGIHERLSVFEQQVLMKYILQLEVVSHAGKALPTMSIFPPLGMFITKYDDWNPWFHAVHHKLLRCNYSITPFWDWVFGTDRYE